MTDIWNPEQTILVNENEKKPNRHSMYALLTITAVVVVAWILNELKVFHVSPVLMRICAIASIILCLGLFLIIKNEKLVVWKGTKYIIMSSACIYTFLVMLLLTFHVTTALIFPLLLAMLYRSKKIEIIAVVSSVFCTVFPPVVGYLAQTWDVPFVSFLTMLGARADIKFIENTYDISLLQGAWYVFVYISLPRLFIVLACALVMHFVVKTGIKNVKDQIRIQHLSERDTLTGLYNQNFYKTVLESELGNGTIGVLFFDVNGLKRENDTKGHEYGDLLLRRCADSIHRILDEKTTGYRVGGDEFLVLVRTDSEEFAREKINKWRSALDQINFEYRLEENAPVCSMEVGFAFGRINDLTELISQADSRMYEYKNRRKCGCTKNKSDRELEIDDTI